MRDPGRDRATKAQKLLGAESWLLPREPAFPAAKDVPHNTQRKAFLLRRTLQKWHSTYPGRPWERFSCSLLSSTVVVIFPLFHQLQIIRFSTLQGQQSTTTSPRSNFTPPPNTSPIHALHNVLRARPTESVRKPAQLSHAPCSAGESSERHSRAGTTHAK